MLHGANIANSVEGLGFISLSDLAPCFVFLRMQTRVQPEYQGSDCLDNVAIKGPMDEADQLSTFQDSFVAWKRDVEDIQKA